MNCLCWCSSGGLVHYVGEIMEWNFIRKWIKVVALLWCCGSFYASTDQYLFTTWWRKRIIRWIGGGCWVFWPDALKQSSLAQWWVSVKNKNPILWNGPWNMSAVAEGALAVPELVVWARESCVVRCTPWIPLGMEGVVAGCQRSCGSQSPSLSARDRKERS